MKRRVYSTKRNAIFAAGEDDDFAIDEEGMDSFVDEVSDVSDAVDDIKDMIEEDDKPVDTIIDTENNIDNHYIAECDRCHEVFISAVIESDSDVTSVTGECPMCHEETEQLLKWIIRSVNDSDAEKLV